MVLFLSVHGSVHGSDGERLTSRGGAKKGGKTVRGGAG